ncbi:hypothetical protein H0G86_000876 [Trichoderma simmonsii]|uniref:Uncharacterized protein n=1 Tax=Trichoderma simmonsii TaxID=1491479 RepID=A0A8G0L0H8_9HYPO|nr:hypothetical protein H0G86_000876 [Trichoderma simmonsii]
MDNKRQSPNNQATLSSPPIGDSPPCTEQCRVPVLMPPINLVDELQTMCATARDEGLATAQRGCPGPGLKGDAPISLQGQGAPCISALREARCGVCTSSGTSAVGTQSVGHAPKYLSSIFSQAPGPLDSSCHQGFPFPSSANLAWRLLLTRTGGPEAYEELMDSRHGPRHGVAFAAVAFAVVLSSGQPITPLRGNSAANGAILLAAR